MGNEIFEEIKQRYEKSNKYMLCVTYEDIGILIHIIDILDKQLKYRKEENNIKLTKEIEEDRNKFKKRDYISKKKLNKKIEDFKIIRDTIIQNEKELKRPMMTYDLKRNDYCVKMLESLLNEEE